jgi:hypothetical protein
MKRVLLFITFMSLMACQKGADKTASPTAAPTGTEYFAEYGIPDQNLIQPCSGDRDLVRPVSKCVKRSTNAIVDNSLCYNLPPLYMTIPSPGGQRQMSMAGGIELDMCSEGSQEILSTLYLCNMGFFLQGSRCLSYQTVGSYALQKDQIYKSKNGLRLLMTIGDDINVKEKDNLRLIMLME